MRLIGAARRLTSTRESVTSAVRARFSRVRLFRPFRVPDWSSQTFVSGAFAGRLESCSSRPTFTRLEQLTYLTWIGERHMTGGKIRIRMEAYDHQALDASAREIVDHAKRTGARVAGPVPLPTRREIYTVNRSPFVDKKSREQFEIRTHKRIIDITEPNHRTVEALNRLVVPAGVFVKIKA